EGWLFMNLKTYKEFFLLFCLISLLSALSSCTNNTASKGKDVHATQTRTSTPNSTTCSEDNPSGKATSQITVIVKQNCVLGVSNYAAGLTYNDNSLLSFTDGGSGNADAVGRVDGLIRGTISYENTHIMGWGAADPWPDPKTPDPTDWGSLDQR